MQRNFKRGSRGRFAPLSAAAKTRVLAALHDRWFGSYAQIADTTGVAKSTVIALNNAHKIRVGGALPFHEKQQDPLLHNRRVAREAGIVKFIKDASRQRIKVSINLLQKRFGGEKRDIGRILARETELLEKTGGKIARRTKRDQPKRKLQEM